MNFTFSRLVIALSCAGVIHQVAAQVTPEMRLPLVNSTSGGSSTVNLDSSAKLSNPSQVAITSPLVNNLPSTALAPVIAPVESNASTAQSEIKLPIRLSTTPVVTTITPPTVTAQKLSSPASVASTSVNSSPSASSIQVAPAVVSASASSGSNAAIMPIPTSIQGGGGKLPTSNNAVISTVSNTPNSIALPMSTVHATTSTAVKAPSDTLIVKTSASKNNPIVTAPVILPEQVNNPFLVKVSNPPVVQAPIQVKAPTQTQATPVVLAQNTITEIKSPSTIAVVNPPNPPTVVTVASTTTASNKPMKLVPVPPPVNQSSVVMMPPPPPKTTEVESLPGIGAIPGENPAFKNKVVKGGTERNEMSYISATFVNRIATPFLRPRVIDQSGSDIKVDGSDVYVKTNSTLPIAIYIIDDASRQTISMTLVPKNLPAQTIVAQIQTQPIVGSGEKANQLPEEYIAKLTNINSFVAQNKLPAGFTESALPASLARMGNLSVAPITRYSGSSYDVYKYKLTSGYQETVELKEESFYNSDLIRTISFFPVAVLEPGQVTYMFIISDKPQSEKTSGLRF
jgi:conjugal transfer pilus assembly protein TraK